MSGIEFVERPAAWHGAILAALIATADNGKAISRPKQLSGGYVPILKAKGLRLHQHHEPDGTITAWCERIAPTNGHGAESVAPAPSAAR